MVVDPEHRYSNESEREVIYDDFKSKNLSGLHGLYKIIRRSKGYAERELSPMSKLGW